MYKIVGIESLDDFFSKKSSKVSYSIHFEGLNKTIKDFISKYYAYVSKHGVIIEGGLKNPTADNTRFFMEKLPSGFKYDSKHLSANFKIMFPNLEVSQINLLTESLLSICDDLKAKGKNDSVLSNAYIKIICWLYYKFNSLLSKLGTSQDTKILYEGNIGTYELSVLGLLASCGCDVVILNYDGESLYKKYDSEYKYSTLFKNGDVNPFDSSSYNLTLVRKNFINKQRLENILGSLDIKIYTNLWLNMDSIDEIIDSDIYSKPIITKDEDIFVKKVFRHNEHGYMCNYFIRINGVDNKDTIAERLFDFRERLKGLKTAEPNFVIENNKIPAVTALEMASFVRPDGYTQEEFLLNGLNAIALSNKVSKIVKNQFYYFLSNFTDLPLNKFKEMVLKFLCLIHRYKHIINQSGTFIMFSGDLCDFDINFLHFLSTIPVDVLILNLGNCKQDLSSIPSLFEFNFNDSLSLETYPIQTVQSTCSTVAYNAEQDLDKMLYQDTGIYRDRQYSKSNVVLLRTMYEEIELLWREELKLRQGFITSEDVVIMPVIYAKVSGVKDKDISAYNLMIDRLKSCPSTILIEDSSIMGSSALQPMYIAEVMKSMVLDKNLIKNHAQYKYGFLRDSVQDYIIDKLQVLLDSKVIKGTYKNGVENTILTVCMNLPMDIVRLLQNFDLTKVNPKIIYINKTEETMSLHDTIVYSFLSCLGFDVLFLIPTGYATVEKYLDRCLFTEYQVGEYVYNLDRTKKDSGKSFINKLFGRS